MLVQFHFQYLILQVLTQKNVTSSIKTDEQKDANTELVVKISRESTNLENMKKVCQILTF